MKYTLAADEDTFKLIDALAYQLGSTIERVMKIALVHLAIDLGVKFELPRKEKEHAG